MQCTHAEEGYSSAPTHGHDSNMTNEVRWFDRFSQISIQEMSASDIFPMAHGLLERVVWALKSFRKAMQQTMLLMTCMRLTKLKEYIQRQWPRNKVYIAALAHSVLVKLQTYTSTQLQDPMEFAIKFAVCPEPARGQQTPCARSRCTHVRESSGTHAWAAASGLWVIGRTKTSC